MMIHIRNRKMGAQFCKGFSNFIGFMFQPSSKHAKVLTFENEQKVSLHMLFVFFPLLAIFLNNKKRVVEITNLKPFTFYTSKKKAKYVVEIPSTLAKELRIKIGDKINL